MRLVRGAPGAGKTALVFHEFASALREGTANLRIIVPTATLVRHYQHELARAGLVFDPAMVTSLSRFAQQLVPNLTLVSPDLLHALVRDVLSRLPLPEFAQVGATSGMTDVIIETITRFENANCTPTRLAAIRNLNPHGKAFLRVWKEVDNAITARNFVTRGQLFRAASATITPSTLWLDGFIKFSPVESEFLRALAVTCDITLTLANDPANDEARRLAMELGASDRLLTSPPRQPETIAVTAPTPEREADEIARRILDLRAAGTDFPAIAVALRDVENWLPLLRTTFDRFGIPARYYFSEPVKAHPVAVFLGGLLTCAQSDWDFAPTLAALRAHPAFGRTPDFDRFDFRVREAMPSRGAEALLSHCQSPRLRADIEDCLKVASWTKEPATPQAWQSRFEQFAERLYRIPTVAPPRDYAAIETARSHAAGLRAWAAAVATATEFLPADTQVSFESFHKAVAAALESAGMQIPDHRRNVVHVMSAFEARQWQVRTLFVCGMTARDYPRRAQQNLLFTDAELDRLKRAGIPVRTTADEDRDEDTLFTSLQSRASEKLILTVSSHDAQGKTILPSRFFPPSQKSASCSVAPVGQAFPPARFSKAGHIDFAALPGLAEQHQTIGLTSLEDLAKCRFRFFAGRTLKLKGVPDRPDKRLTPSASGLIVHKAMETWLSDRTRDFVALFETTFDEFCREKRIQPGYKLEVERIQLRRVARKVNESVQWPLVSSETEADCSIDFPGGITVTCRIDRIDRLENKNDCIIIDYKAGKTANVKKLVERETSLQGPLYALAVREKKGLNPVAMVFLAVREDKPFGWGEIPGAQGIDLIPTPPDWIDSARDRTIARLESFLAGDIHAGPTNADDCQWCDFKTVCRIEVEENELIQIGAANV